MLSKADKGVKIGVGRLFFNMSKYKNNSSLKSLSEGGFLDYLYSKLDSKILAVFKELSKSLDIIIFSGVIRDFALHHNGELRDLDLVVKNNFDKLDEILNHFDYVSYRRNTFGGYKLLVNGLTIDIWELNETWAIKEQKVPSHIFVEEDLPTTSFFNFASIVFDVNANKFIPHKSFVDFLKTRTLDIVLEDNPFPELCVVNTFYYKDKYDLKISNKLKRYLVNNFFNIPADKFDDIQIKHFKEIKYNRQYLESKIVAFSKQVK